MTDDLKIRELVLKATVAGSDVQVSAAKPDADSEALQAVFGKVGVLSPPYDPITLIRIFENSSALPQNVEAYMTNVDGLGFNLEPVFAFDSPDVFEKVREAMWLGNESIAPMDGVEGNRIPDDAEVEAMVTKLKRQARLEELKLTQFFTFLNPDGSFTSLRRATRQNLEVTGNAYWEVLRNGAGKIARMVLVPSTSIRLMSLDKDPVKVTDRVPLGPIHADEVVQYRFFRRYVQAIASNAVYFKEFGDPRVVSRDTGKVFKDLADFKENTRSGDALATEMLHFKLLSPGEVYGVPRWTGTLLAVLGSRAADEVNYDYFENKAIPPLAILVSGGRLGKDDVSRIETYIRDQIKGKSNFHKILIIEAVASDAQQLVGNAPLPTIKFERLSDQQLSEGQFQQYDERNIDKIGSAFRLPRLMRGDVRDFNRASAMASLRFAEEQVFDPERQEFDALINRRILPELGVSLWRFRSNSNHTRDPEIVAAIAEKLTKANVTTINEARRIVSDVLGVALPPLPDLWAKQPIQLTLAGFIPGGTTEEANINDALRSMLDEANSQSARQTQDIEGEKDLAMRGLQEALTSGVENEEEV